MPGRILLVDDSPTLRRVAAAMLVKGGYEALMASDGEQALEMLRGEGRPIEAALIDLVLPRFDGAELCKRLRADPKRKGLPVVLMSAALERLDEAADKVGASGTLPKPFDGVSLRAAVDRAIKQARASQRAVPKAIPSSAPTPASPTPAAGPVKSSPSSSTLTAAAPAAPAPAPMDATALAVLVQAVLRELGGRGWYERHEVEAAARKVIERQRANEPPEGPVSAEGAPREVLRGQADAVPLGEVLQVLQMQMQTGVLEVKRNDPPAEVRIYLRNGLVDLVSAPKASSEFRVGRYLREEGLIDPETLDDAVVSSRKAGQLLGDELVGRGVIDRTQLVHILARQSSELIYEMLRWTEARYAFVRGATPERGVEAELGLPVASLVMEGFRRVDEWRLIEEHIKPEVVLERDEAAVARQPAGRHGPLGQRLLESIDGRRTVHEVLEAASASSFDGSKLLLQFVQSRLVRKRTSS